MNPNEKTTAPRKYKRSTVERWMDSAASPPGRLPPNLGVNVQSLHKWKQQFKALPAEQAGHTHLG